MLNKKYLTKFTQLGKIFSTKKNKYSAGFTLIELIITIGIFILVMILGSNYIISTFRFTTFGSEQETAIQNARRAIEIISKEIRGANNSSQGDYPLARIDDDDFIFYSDINNDGLMEKVRYFLDGSTLKKVVTPPGPDNNYQVAGVTSTIANYINNQESPIFVYYNSNKIITDKINEIRLIGINLKINVTPSRAPNDYYVETDVNLRNLKDNL